MELSREYEDRVGGALEEFDGVPFQPQSPPEAMRALRDAGSVEDVVVWRAFRVTGIEYGCVTEPLAK